MKIIPFLIATLALLACQTVRAQPAETPPYRLVDLSDDFAAFYDRTEGMTPEARVAAFKTDIIPLFPEFYGRERFSTMTDEQFDRRIATAIERFPQYRETYLAKAAQFEALLTPAFASFRRVFPDVRPIGEIHLLNSLGEMDGGTRTFHGRVYVIFGADVLARSHPYEDEAPFFHHELFHTYHDDYFSDCGSVWCALWIEGLATYAAKALNPEATDAQLLLTVPEPIPAAVDANLTEAVCFVRARINSRQRDDLRVLFSFDRANERLPPRFGHYVGYLVAREAAGDHSLQALARMNNVEAAAIVSTVLARLAACPAN
jgi:hypothetical protein